MVFIDLGVMYDVDSCSAEMLSMGFHSTFSCPDSVKKSGFGSVGKRL